MLDLKLITNETEYVKSKLKTRGFDISKIDEIVKLSRDRSFVMSKLQSLEFNRNKFSKEIGVVKKKNGNIEKHLKQVSKIKLEIESVKDNELKINNLIKEKLLLIPNLPSDNTPVGESENDNVIIMEHGNLGRGKISAVKSNYDIAIDLDIVDFKRAVKMSGTRFWAYKGQGAKLVRALENFMLDIHIKNGYEELRPPIVVNSATMQGTGQLPKFKKDLFKIENMNLYLIPTAEVPLTNFYSNEILDLTSPIYLTAFTNCFRAEAGSGGKDMRGLIRAHQFNKVELVKIVTKEQLKEEYSKTVSDAKNILELLQLPYRELQLVSGDIGFSAEETIDLEVWLPSEKKYRETSSISSFSNFQGRRAMIRYKDKIGKTNYAYTINGSGLAIDRIVAAILENYQNDDGTITVPKVLENYMGTNIIK